jgi:hypothetical protein
LGFSAAIAKRIPQCKGGLEGFCSYTFHKSIQMKMGELPLQGMSQLSPANMLTAFGENLETALMLAKGLTYIDQQEYRLLWGVPRPMEKTLTITCPEARQFCDKVDIPTRYLSLSSRIKCYAKSVSKIVSKLGPIKDADRRDGSP